MGKQREKEGAHRTAHRQDDPNTHTHTHIESLPPAWQGTHYQSHADMKQKKQRSSQHCFNGRKKKIRSAVRCE